MTKNRFVVELREGASVDEILGVLLKRDGKPVITGWATVPITPGAPVDRLLIFFGDKE